MNAKTISFGELKTKWASRLIDIDRRIHILRETKGFIADDMKEDYYKVIASLADAKLWIESIRRRAGENDTIDIINKQMKAKALRDIDKWENGNGD